LTTIGIVAVTWLLFNVAYGYGRGKNGQIVLNGLVYISSQPNPATITLNGKTSKSQTNTRLLLPSGHYTLQLSRDGYRNWQRSFSVDGGDVQHVDYPLLFPKNLTTSNLQTYTAPPGMATQSPDHRWLLIEQVGSFTNFDLYDLKSPTKAPVTVSLPASLLSSGANQSWQVVEWSSDNQHVLLTHLHGSASEFIMLDRANPAQSLNLNRTFSENPSTVSLNDRKYDQYYLYDAAQQTLQTASLRTPQPASYLDHILSYKSYSNNTVLYATTTGAVEGKVFIDMQVGNKTYHVRDIPTASTYPLDLTQYNGRLYVVVASPGENKVFIYKDPAGQLDAAPSRPTAAMRALLINQPNFVSFSANTQFIMAESGNSLSVYDLENARNYRYSLGSPLDAPQSHAFWMDGDRLVYVSGGKLQVADYDNANTQTLMPASPNYQPFFAPDYRHVFALAPAASQAAALTETALLTPADQ
jgi:hypothetical protein